MEKKVYMVTGATDGIGKETAWGLARQGATVVVVGRNAEKAERVVEEIQRATGNQRVESMIADFSSLEQVGDLAAAFGERYDRLDGLVNNAGVVTRERQESQDGLELMFAVNYLASFLLTNSLLEMRLFNAPARIVNVSSMGYKRGQIQFDDLQSEVTFEPRQAYYQTRLAIVLYTLALARRLEGTGITVNTVHPGIVRTNLSHNYMANPVFRFFERMIAVSPASGAEPSIHLASSPAVEGVTGHYFNKMTREPVAEFARNQGLQERLWEVSESLVAPVALPVG